jgi:hypothetical protein
MSARRLLWWWASACAAAGILCAAFEAAQLFSQPAPDPIALRYAPAREALRGAGVAGFLSDDPLDGDAGALRFHRALYGVAPTVLRPNSQERVLLVDLAHPERLTRLLTAPDLRLRKDLGNGLAVVEKR